MLINNNQSNYDKYIKYKKLYLTMMKEKKLFQNGGYNEIETTFFISQITHNKKIAISPTKFPNSPEVLIQPGDIPVLNLGIEVLHNHTIHVMTQNTYKSYIHRESDTIKTVLTFIDNKIVARNDYNAGVLANKVLYIYFNNFTLSFRFTRFSLDDPSKTSGDVSFSLSENTHEIVINGTLTLTKLAEPEIIYLLSCVITTVIT